ncbi:adenosylcobinamide-phosphate synthase CbiB [Dehalobacterium formicoaceticum]|uniref:adenosylcobinamide-phosphate synthase CbiB n=1 Tax=Dehalobacterium formicoaceticum TaxID=51515 RepID=UPI0031F660FC
MVNVWAAYLLDLIIGDPRGFPHPVIYIGKLISFLENQIRKKAKTEHALRVGGAFLTLITVLIPFTLTWGVLFLAGKIHPYLFYFMNILLMWTCLATKSLRVESMRVYHALAEGDLPQARINLSYIVGRDTRELEEDEVVKATVETVAENTADGIIAPLFYMAIGGAPLAMTYKAINTMDSMIGYKNEKYLHLGRTAAKLDDLVNWIPARITGIFLGLSSLFLNFNVGGSFKILLRDRRNHTSPNCGYPEAATAGALDIQLGGTHTYFQQTVYKPTIGDDIRPVEGEDIKRTVKLMYLASFLTMVVFSLIFWMIKG